MNTRTSTKVMGTAAIVMGWTWLTAQQCGDAGPTGPRTVQNCPIFYDSDFPTGGNVTRNKPASCPITVGSGPLVVPYAATADLPAGSVSYEFYQWQSVTWNGYVAGFFGNAVWSQGGGRYFVNITGDYRPAQGGFDANNNGWDDIKHGFYSSYTRWWTYATTRIDYRFGIPRNTITTPAYIEPGQQYSVSATTDDPLLVSPVTWSWYVDGSHVETTTEPNTYVGAPGEPYTSQSLEVVVTDGNGHSVAGQKTVITGSGCGSQLQC